MLNLSVPEVKDGDDDQQVENHREQRDGGHQSVNEQ